MTHATWAAALLAPVVLLGVPAGAQDVYMTDNIVIVLDASGSMSETMADAQGRPVVKMQAAKAALLDVLERVEPTTQVGLLAFSGSGYADPWVSPLGVRDDARLREGLRRIAPGGDTPLGTAIKRGADCLLQKRRKQHGYGTYRLLVITDGEANPQDELDKVERYTPEIIARGIRFDVIGVAMRGQHTLATRVHSYRSANDPAALARAIREVFAEVPAKGTHDVGEDAFAVVGGIPDKLASAMVRALAETGNEPIGEGPGREPPPVPSSSRPSGPMECAWWCVSAVGLIAAGAIVLVVVGAAAARRRRR